MIYTCIIQVEILANKSEHENQVDKSVSKIDDGKLIECIDNPLPKEMISPSFDKLVDFRALGRVLHFLKTKRVKDMDYEDGCNHLQNLWDELKGGAETGIASQVPDPDSPTYTRSRYLTGYVTPFPYPSGIGDPRSHLVLDLDL
ncbi:hypothetical protein JHK82_027376 [Glycine max]|nr:hypothetical protein JHK82_027376 [Glycine max]